MHNKDGRRRVEVRRVDQVNSLDELFKHCLPAFGGAFLRRIYTILDHAIAMGCPMTIAISGPVTVSGQHQSWLIPLLETGWIRLRGRRKAPGRPVTYGTNEAFLSHFGLEALTDLPGLDELRGAGLVDKTLPADFSVPVPSDDPALREDEEPLEPGDLDLGLVPPEGRSEE